LMLLIETVSRLDQQALQIVPLSGEGHIVLRPPNLLGHIQRNLR
jgi:hypothetical protein